MPQSLELRWHCMKHSHQCLCRHWLTFRIIGSRVWSRGGRNQVRALLRQMKHFECCSGEECFFSFCRVHKPLPLEHPSLLLFSSSTIPTPRQIPMLSGHALWKWASLWDRGLHAAFGEKEGGDYCSQKNWNNYLPTARKCYFWGKREL